MQRTQENEELQSDAADRPKKPRMETGALLRGTQSQIQTDPQVPSGPSLPSQSLQPAEPLRPTTRKRPAEPVAALRALAARRPQ